MADRIILPRALDSNGNVVSGARAYFYDTGTTNTQTGYSDSAGTTPVSQPLSADASGAFAATYTTQNAVKVDIVDSGASSLPGYPSDPHYKVPATGSAASNITFTPSTENPQTNVQDAIDELLESPDFSSITNAATVRTDLGLAIGTDVQAYDAALADIAGLTQAAGDVLFSDGTNWSNLAIGAAGKILTVNSGGTAPEWGQGVGLEYDTGVDVTSGQAVTVTTSIPAGVNEITVMIEDISFTGSDNLLCQIGGVSGFLTTGYDSYSVISGSTGASENTGFVATISSSGNSLQSGEFRLMRFENHVWHCAFNGLMKQSTSRFQVIGAGFVDLAEEITQIRIGRSASGTFNGASGRALVNWR